MNLSAQFKEFLLSQATPASKVTIKNYVSDINKFINWFETKFNKKFDPTAVSFAILSLFKAESLKAYSASSVDRNLSSLRKFFTFLKLESKISHSPFEAEKNIASQSLVEADPWKIKDFKNYLYVFNASHLTIKNYIIDVKQFANWAQQSLTSGEEWETQNEDFFSKIDSNLVEEYKKRLLNEAGLSPVSVNRKLSSLRKYFTWAISEGIINSNLRVPGESKLNQEEDLRLKIKESDDQILAEANHQSSIVNRQSSFPPFRLLQKSKLALIEIGDLLLILPLVYLLEKASYGTWVLQGKPITSNGSSKLVSKILGSNKISKRPYEVKNYSKEFYAPSKVSTKYYSLHKKAWHHIKNTRPEWYKKYRNTSFATFFRFVVLALFTGVLTYATYSYINPNKNQPKTLAALPSAPPRVLSFQGRLTDNSDNPITGSTPLRMAIYSSSSASGSALLWQEIDTATPDSDGIFNIILGNNTAIPQSVFANNSALYLGVTVQQTPELTPRQQIATVAFAANAETLQGLPPITNSTNSANVVLALNSSGNLSIGNSASPTFQATGGTFTLAGQVTVINTNTGSNGNIVLEPDGTGIVDIRKPLQNTSNTINISTAIGALEVDDLFAILATSSGQSAFTLNQTSTGPLLSASTGGVAKFTVDNGGNVTAAGTINGLTVSNGTISSGTWQATAISSTYGGTGLNTSGSTGVPYISGGNWSVDANYLASNHGGTGFGTYAQGDLIYASAVNTLAKLTVGGASTCLTSNGTVPSWGSCGSGTGTNWWTTSTDGKAIAPINTTQDLLIGGIATTSAKFAFLNNAGGTPTASISANSGNIATYLTGTGQLSTTNRQSLTIGNNSTNNTTGNVLINSNGQGNVGIGTTAPTFGLDVNTSLHLTGTAKLDSYVGIGNYADTNVGFVRIDANTAVPALYINQNSSGTALTLTGTASISSNLAFNGSGTTHTVSTFDGGNINFDMVGGGSGTGTSALYLQKTGNVGIGTTNPGAKLSVIGNGSGLVHVGTNGCGGNFSAITLGATADSACQNYTLLGEGSHTYLNAPNGGNIYMRVANLEKMIIKSTGEVGIGTVTPFSELHVTRALTSGATGKALVIFDQIENQDIFTASASGTPIFTITRAGGIALGTNGLSVGSTAQCLLGGATAIWGSCGTGLGTNWWTTSTDGKAITPINTTQDLLIGGIATTSAKFAFLNNAGGTPTASISGNSGNIATYLTGTGNLQTTNGQSLVLGGTTTGLVQVNNKAGSAFTTFDTVNSRVGIGTSTPLTALDVLGSASLSANLSLRGANTAHTFNVLDGGSLNIQRSVGGDAGVTSSLFIDKDGMIGVGNSSPRAAFHIGSNDYNFIRFEGGIYGDSSIQQFYSETSWAQNTYGRNIGGSGYIYDVSGPASRISQDSGNINLQTAVTGTAGNLITWSTKLFVANGGNIGVGTSNPLTTLDIRAISATMPVASISGSTVNATLVLDNSGTGDLFSASKSGATKFVIQNNGNLQFAGTTNFLTALASAATAARTITFPDATGTICLQSSTSCGFSLGSNLWQLNNGAISPFSSTADVLFGSTASSTAKFAFLNNAGGTPTASISANSGNIATYMTGLGNLQTTNSQTLTLGGSTTGLVQVNNKAGSSFTTFDTVNSRVGIGTSTPSYKLHVTGTSTPVLSLESTDSSGATIQIFNSGYSAYTFTTSANAMTIGNSSTGTFLSFSATAGPNASAFTGLLGVGISPTARLQISGSGATTGKSLAIFDQIEQQDILTASAAGTPIFTVTRAGGIALGTNGLSFGNSSQCLLGGATATWGTCGGTTNWWTTSTDGKAITPINTTQDLLIGGISTSSAKFAFLNNAGGTPTASISANSGNIATYMTGLGNLQTTNSQTLTLGGSTTGNIVLSPLNSIAGARVIPGADNLVSIGATSTARFKDIFVGAGSVHVQCTTGDGCGGSGLDYAMGVNTSTGTFSIGVNGTTAVGNPLLNITQGGNVGIGTTTPSSLFSVGASSQFQVNTSGNVSAGTYNGNTITTGTGTLTLGAGKTLTVSGSTTLADNVITFGGTETLTLTATKNVSFADAFTTSGANPLTLTTTGSTNVTLPTSGTLCSTTTCATGTNWWTTSTDGKAITPINTTQDLLIGGIATTSAKFAILNTVAALTPVASLSATTASGGNGNGIVLDAGGSIQSLRGNTLSIGGTTTGLVNINSKAGSAFTTFDTLNSRVGIGDSTPDSILDIAGDLIIGDESTTTEYGITFQNSAATGASTNGWAKIKTAATTDGRLQFFTNLSGTGLTEKMSILRTGEVGLGTTSPASELHVTRPLTFGATGKALAVFDQIENQDIFTASKSGATMFAIDQSGNVGIKTGASSSYSLLVQGNDVMINGAGTAADNTLTIQSGTSKRATLNFTNGGNLKWGLTNGGDGVNDFWLWDQVASRKSFNAASNGDLTLMPTAGKVGIGTTTPTSEFHVTRAAVSSTAPAIGKALVNFDQIENQDIFTASASGTPILTITRAGGIALGTNGLSFGTTSQCLLGGAPASWGSCGTGTGTNWWTTSTDGKAIAQVNTTQDLLIGGIATTSAKFAFTGLSSGLTQASISGQLIVMPNNGFGGKVGIGTTTPTELLDIAGSSSNPIYARVANSSSGGTGFLVTNSAGASAGRLLYDNNNAKVIIGSITSSPLAFFTNNTEVARFDTSGNLSLGTLPGIFTGSTPTASISANSSNNATFLNGTGNLGTTNKQTLTLGGATTGLVQVNNSAGTTFTTFDTVNSRVGIGTSTPTDFLTVKPTGTGGVLVRESDNGFDAARLYGDADSGYLDLTFQGTTKINFTAWGGANSYFNTGANFGFGTTTPTALLDVAGTASVGGQLTFRSGTAQIQSTANQTLTLGGSTTGYINLLPLNGSGKVGINTNTPISSLDINVGTARTNSATGLSIQGTGALGDSATNYAYPFDVLTNPSGNNIRLQTAAYRRVAGSTWNGSSFRLQYAVDNSFTDGSKAYVEIGAGDVVTSGGGFIALGTNGSDRLAITHAGLVGVNTITPTAQFDVAGAASIGGQLTFRSGTAQIQSTANQTLSLGGTTTGLINVNNNSGTAFTTFDTVNSRVGIGDTTPTASLTVGSGDLFQVSSAGLVTIAATSGNAITINNTGIAFDLTMQNSETIDNNTDNTISFGFGAAGGGLNLSSATNSVISATARLDLQSDGAVDVNIAGGSGGTGCTVTNSSGNLACSGTVTANGTVLSQYWQRVNGNLSPVNVNDTLSATSSADTVATFTTNNPAGTLTNNTLINNTGAGTVTNLLNLTRTAGTVTNGLTFSGTFTNLISSTNFNVTNGGAVTAVGVNAGSGQIQGTGGLSVSGNTTLAATGGNTVGIGNSTGVMTLASGGTSAWTNTSGNLTISTATSGTLALDSAGSLTVGATSATGLTLGRSGVTTTFDSTAWTATPTISGLVTGTLGFSVANGQAYSGTGAVTLSSGANNNLTLTPNGTGVTLISADADSGLQVSSIAPSASTLHPLFVNGGISNRAAFVVNNTNSGDLITASASGTTRFTVSTTGAISAATSTNTINNLIINAGALSGITTINMSGQLTSTLATGTAPFVVASTTNVANLNASSLNGATFAAPGAIGSGTPSTGAFTTLDTGQGANELYDMNQNVQTTDSPTFAALTLSSGGTDTTSLIITNTSSSKSWYMNTAGSANGYNPGAFYIGQAGVTNFLIDDVTGNVSLSGDLAISGGNITTAFTADSTVTIAGTGTALTLSGAATTAINISNTGVTTDISLQNGETIDNNTDGIVKIGGNVNGALDDTYFSWDYTTNRIGFTKKSGGAGKLTYGSANSFAIAQSNATGIDVANTFTDRFVIDSTGNVAVSTGTFTSAGLITASSGVTIAANQNLTMNSGTGVFAQTFTGTTTDAFSITSNSMTIGEMLNLNGTWAPTDGSTNEAIDINITHTPTTNADNFSSINLTTTDGTALANTVFGLNNTITFTGNAGKTSYGIYSNVTSSSTTADTLNGIYSEVTSSSGISSGTRTLDGIRGLASSLGTNGGGTTNIYGGYFSTQVLGTGGTQNSYGVYIADSGTSAGTSRYGLYVAAVSGATTNYAAYFAGGVLKSVGNINTDGHVTVDTGLYFASNWQWGLSSNMSATEDCANTTDFCLSRNGGVAKFKITTGGNATLQGALTQNATPDVAENINVDDVTIESGDIVTSETYNPSEENEYNKAIASKANKPYSNAIIGGISSDPGILINANLDSHLGQLNIPNSKPLTIAGRIPVKVSTINGEVKTGDSVTSSEIPGIGMKATNAGKVLGTVMTDYVDNNSTQSAKLVNESWQTQNSKCAENEADCYNYQKVLVLISPNWHDPDVQLADSGYLTLSPTVNNNFEIKRNGDAFVRIGAFSELISAKIRVGIIEAQSTITYSLSATTAIIMNLTTSTLTALTANFGDVSTNTLAIATSNITIAGQSIQDFITGIVDQRLNESGSTNQESGIAKADIISPLSSKDLAIKLPNRDSKFVIKNASNSAVASIDASGNASFAGQLTSDNLTTNKDATIGGTLRAGRIIADSIEGLNITASTVSATYITNNYYNATQSASTASNSSQLTANNSGIISSQGLGVSSGSASFGSIFAETATFNQRLMAFGPASFFEASVADRLFVGSQLTIADKSINVLGGNLQIQPLRQGGVSFVAGLVEIDPDGNLRVDGNAVFAKNVSVKGKLAANIISPLAGNDLNIELEEGKSVKFRTGTGAASLVINNKGDIIASGAGTFAKLNLNIVGQAQAVSLTEVNATGSAGLAEINANQEELTINNVNVTAKSLIYVTQKTSTPNQSVYLIRQTAEDSETDEVEGSFTVGISTPINKKIPFNWIIIN